MQGKALLRYVAEFTRRYRTAPDIYAREADCLRWQFAHSLQPLQAGDLVAGRLVRPLVGVRAQEFWGVGYYAEEDALWRLTVDESLTPEERDEAAELLAYWKRENTRVKISDAYPEGWLDVFVHNAPYYISASAHGLYRISGIQMDPTRVLTLGVEGLLALCAEKREQNPP